MAEKAGSDQHPDPSLLERFMRNEVRPAERRWVVRHLLSRCSSCMAVTRRLWALGDPPAAMRPPYRFADLTELIVTSGDLAEPQEPDRPAAPRREPTPSAPLRPAARGRLQAESYTEVFQRLAETGRRVAAERREAPRLVALILASPPADWAALALAEGGPTGEASRRFRTAPVCELLLDRGRDVADLDAAFTLRLAELALAIADRLDPAACSAAVVQTLRARAWGCLGDARRRRGDLAGAGWALGMAERLAAGPGGPPQPAGAAVALGEGPAAEPNAAADLSAAAGNDAEANFEAMAVPPLSQDVAGLGNSAGGLADGAGGVADSALEPVEWAEILVWKADLAGDLGDLGEAERLLARAAAFYHAAGDPVLEGGVRMRQGLVRAARADAGAAVELLRAAVTLLDRPPGAARRQTADALCHLAVQLQAGNPENPETPESTEIPETPETLETPETAQAPATPQTAGIDRPTPARGAALRHRGAEALRALARARALYRELEDPVAEARAWRLQGQLEAAADRLDEAEATFAGSAAALAELGLGREAALARVELALVLARTGRAAEAGRLQLHRRPPLYTRDASWVWFSALLVFQSAVARTAAPAGRGAGEALFVELARYLAGRPLVSGAPGGPRGLGGPHRLGLVA
jgi:tetratricopeptide (TPR) repeat protein